LRNAYDRAFSAIFDANVTTAITAAVLYWAGSEEVRGFGLTLMLGIAVSMFTALYVTRTIFGLMIDKGGLTKLSSIPLMFPAWDRLLRPNINWMRYARLAFVGSTAFIIAGCLLLANVWRQGNLMDIEFASGTSVQVELASPLRIEEVRQHINRIAGERPTDLPAPAVVAVGTGLGGTIATATTYEIVSPNPNSIQVREAVIAALGELMKIELASTFEQVGQDYAQATRAGAVVPITSDELRLPERTIDDASAHAGGVAIVLRNLEPTLTSRQIEDRIERQRLQPQVGGGMMPYRDLEVLPLEYGEGDLLRSAVVLVSDAKYPFDADPNIWQSELAVPMWTLVNDAVHNAEQLQRVTNFDPQVAGATALRAIAALILSTVAILLYIWFRFGDVNFGAAATIATIHDVLFVLAAIGFAHYIADTLIGQALMIEAFRMNLTIVAAVLTVMGYSINDTVVIFDRIRENRGKYGVVSVQVINDSINQTFSRTLLTGTTILVTMLMMYIFGGSAIHGFTFTMIVGMIVGTYSSIAIAAPLLLVRFGRGARTSRATPVAQPAT